MLLHVFPSFNREHFSKNLIFELLLPDNMIIKRMTLRNATGDIISRWIYECLFAQSRRIYLF